VQLLSWMCGAKLFQQATLLGTCTFIAFAHFKGIYLRSLSLIMSMLEVVFLDIKHIHGSSRIDCVSGICKIS
jgi:hypothetical protein